MASKRGVLLVERLIKITKERAKDESIEADRLFSQAFESVTNYIGKLEREVRDQR